MGREIARCTVHRRRRLSLDGDGAQMHRLFLHELRIPCATAVEDHTVGVHGSGSKARRETRSSGVR